MKKYFLILAAACLGPSITFGADLRIGIIGCDTSHALAFTQVFNDETNKNHIPGGKVVVAFKGGSKDIPESVGRVDKIANDLQKKYGVKMADTVEELCEQVDVVCLESVDGRPHLEEAKPVFKAHKPVFIDKPVAGSLRDVIEIDKLARENHVAWFSSSAYRWYDSMEDLKTNKVGDIRSVVSFGPCELEEHHPDLYWYGVHATEALFNVMGNGCESVQRTSTKTIEAVTGTWADGSVGILIGEHPPKSGHKVIIFGTKATVEQQKGNDDYAPLVQQIMKFFQTGIAPVSNKETVELYAFMEAADQSKREGGKLVKISDVMKANGGE